MVPRAAPGELERVRRFLNTAEHKDGRKTIPDRLRSRREAEIWLPKLELLPAGTELTKSEVQRIRKLREVLAALVLEARPADASFLDTLREIAEGARFRLVFGADGRPWMRAVGTGLDLAVASLLRIFLEAKHNGRWSRFKVCGACHRVFYDYAQNRSTKWCTPLCGDQVRSRKYLRRRREKEERIRREEEAARFREEHR